MNVLSEQLRTMKSIADKNFSSSAVRPFAKALVLCCLLLSNAFVTYARWMQGAEVPLERLLKNASDYVAKNPNDAQGYYLLGRLHSLAYATTLKQVAVYSNQNGSSLPSLPAYLPVIPHRESGKPAKLTTQTQTHLFESIRNYQKATELAPTDAASFLGLAWVLEDGSAFASQVKAFPKETTADASFWLQKSLEAYRRAYELTVKSDLKKRGLGPGANSAISVEAGEAIVRLMKTRKLSATEQQEISEIERNVSAIQEKPRAITPIIFPLDYSRSLASLLAENATVRFNLAGDDRPSLWPWVKTDTGILVWDEKQTGRIESGRQLFGSVTWWMAWSDGYQPLTMLDDNHDGWLTDHELRGIAVWQDHNGNGVSDPGEVRPVTMHGIAAIAVTAASQGKVSDGTVPQNLRGLRMLDGSFRPTYDWAPQEIKSSPQPILTLSSLK
jgi:hypothetical protein